MKKLAIVYWSGTGNTEAMAEALRDGFQEKSDDMDYFFSDDFSSDMVDDYEKIAFGCPAMGDEVLEEDSFEPMFEDCEDHLKDKEIFIFGSYEWNNGEWMDDWKERCENIGAKFFADPLIAYDYPEDEILDQLKEIGEKAAE
ncbi:MAG: flavodoxin [Tissierellia bacterium]|nr:flavodoxin [Tissierellia bacterium]